MRREMRVVQVQVQWSLKRLDLTQKWKGQFFFVKIFRIKFHENPFTGSRVTKQYLYTVQHTYF